MTDENGRSIFCWIVFVGSVWLEQEVRGRAVGYCVAELGGFWTLFLIPSAFCLDVWVLWAGVWSPNACCLYPTRRSAPGEWFSLHMPLPSLSTGGQCGFMEQNYLGLLGKGYCNKNRYLVSRTYLLGLWMTFTSFLRTSLFGLMRWRR